MGREASGALKHQRPAAWIPISSLLLLLWFRSQCLRSAASASSAHGSKEALRPGGILACVSIHPGGGGVLSICMCCLKICSSCAAVLLKLASVQEVAAGLFLPPSVCPALGEENERGAVDL